MSVRKPGDDHVPLLADLALSTPRPKCPPTTSPPFLTEGNTAMATAFSATHRGTDTSGASLSSFNTSVASFNRSASSCWARVGAVRPRPLTASMRTNQPR